MEHAMEEVIEVPEGFYWVKWRAGCRWEPAEFDGIAWLIGNGTGRDLYVIRPRIMEPRH